ncbi:phosphomannomutase/phosphoglucomutase [Aquicella siphonis]|uniref:phosphomannomutase/phosphoglucomutase n=1 Tax=Aquicella siphonis TaxID=254247 RepID=UPI0038BD156D
METQHSCIHPSAFRSYDIRGIVGKALTKESVFLIGKAIGSLLHDLNEQKITLARDGRHSSPVLAEALSAGLQSAGCDVVNIGVVPTPLLYYATHIFDFHSGVMLTGSHNPSEYNGVKMVIKGATLAENGIQELYRRIVENRLYEGAGTRSDLDIQDDYLAEVKKNIHLARPLRIVIDAGNGVTGMLAPRLFRALGCEVHELFCEVDGDFPHHHPDPSQEENLQDLIRAVRDQQADLGLAFDGDGDRLGVVTAGGKIISPDRLMMLYAKSLLAEQPGAKIIFDVKCTNNLAAMIRMLGGEPIMWKTGHSLIKAKMAETKAQFAGEMSGHLFFKDRWFGFDDALYAGARLLEILADEVSDSDQLFSDIPTSLITPELKVQVADEEKFQLMQRLIERADFAGADEVNTIDGLRVSFADGWGLVRPSNTTPYLILRFEALNEVILKQIQEIFRNWILSVRPDLVLPF